MKLIDKQVGETPLQTLTRLRKQEPKYSDKKLAYAGRLDPLATGQLLVLVEEECKERDKYQGLDKIYRFELLLGISSDSGDVMGSLGYQDLHLENSLLKYDKEALEAKLNLALKKYTGKFAQQYPVFSSKAVQGKPLWRYAKDGELDKIELPKHEIEIKALETLTINWHPLSKLVQNATEKIAKVKGDFRQAEIISEWNELESKYPDARLPIIALRAHVTAGTYIRQLCLDLGSELGTGGLAWSIHREEILLK